jgi:hypothetical protein
MHFHAYLYRGSGEAIEPFDDARRPGGPGFDTAAVPPVMTHCWLAKPSRFIKGTWDDAAEAVAWLRERLAEITDVRVHPEQWAAPSPTTMATSAVQTLSRGNDVVWAWWLTGGDYTEMAVVCCPNRDGAFPCPLGRTDRRPPTATR